MANLIKTKRGLDIQINGKAKEVIVDSIISETIAIVPDYFHGITPKVVVKEGDTVKAGSPVFYDKANSTMNFVSPVSGKVIGVNRGERRKVLSITVQCDKDISYEKFVVEQVSKLSADEVKAHMLKSGLWTYVKQRPYDVIADPNKSAKSIFISGFDSAPLAPNNEFVLNGHMDDFQVGIDALTKLVDAKIQLGVQKGSTFFSSIKNVELTEYQGPHPIGNVGVQINHVNPINKAEVVWTINVQDVLIIGRYFKKGIVDLTKVIALTGPEVIEPKYYKVTPGTEVKSFLKSKLNNSTKLRYISGNVLSGLQVEENAYINPYATQFTVIKEGDDTHEMFGWAMPRLNKFSASRIYFTSILKAFGKKEFDYDARLLGGKRAIIMSGEYDKVLPMDILPEFLIKAMITGNIDKMEALGAYEIAPEDVALCEFVCTSKMPLQLIVRDALDNMKKELE